jgi:hypothetical protein
VKTGLPGEFPNDCHLPVVLRDAGATEREELKVLPAKFREPDRELKPKFSELELRANSLPELREECVENRPGFAEKLPFIRPLPLNPPLR